MDKQDKLGCFISLEKPDYLVKVAKTAIELGAKYAMFYLGSPKRYLPIKYEKLELQKYKMDQFEKVLPLNNIVIHAPWITNPASNNPQTYANSYSSLLQVIKLMEKVELPLMVLHPGSAVNQTREEAKSRLISTLKLLLENSKSVVIAIENMVKKGSLLCTTLEELAEIVLAINSERIGICLDTCHLWDSGINIADIEEIISQLKNLGILHKVKVIHLNDSKYGFNSNRDVHANIDEGTIGLETLKKWAHHSVFADIPKILETPEGKYKEELEILRKNS